jgi:branched-chain amino acid transport system ATP-binding protein
MSAVPAPLLTADGVTLAFGGLSVLKDVSFDVLPGEFFAVIGPNGAGKTSLLNCVNGAYRPSAGSIRFDGQELLGRKPSAIAELGIARTFQNLALFEQLSVIDNVVLGRHHRMRAGLLSGAVWWGRARREEYAARAACEPVLELLGLERYRDSGVKDLPYGIRKRIELARALAMEPQLLVLDEPVAGMNHTESDELAEWVLLAKDRLDLTVLMIEHDMGLVTRLADRVLVLDFGQVVCCEDPATAMADPRVIHAYLGGSGAAAEAVARSATAAVVSETSAAGGPVAPDSASSAAGGLR